MLPREKGSDITVKVPGTSGTITGTMERSEMQTDGRLRLAVRLEDGQLVHVTVAGDEAGNGLSRELGS